MAYGDGKLRLELVRISPRNGAKVLERPRLHIVNTDDNGFVLAEVKLEPGEDYCWRCGGFAFNPDRSLDECPHCGQDFQ